MTSGLNEKGFYSNAEWPANATTGAQIAGRGVSQQLFDAVKRAGVGVQITYAGHPLYLFDSSPGQVIAEGRASNKLTLSGGLRHFSPVSGAEGQAPTDRPTPPSSAKIVDR